MTVRPSSTQAVTLMNPRPARELTAAFELQLGKVPTKATLIVAPKALIGPCSARFAGPGRRY